MPRKYISNEEWLAQLKQLIPNYSRPPKTVAEIAGKIEQLNLKVRGSSEAAIIVRVRRAIHALIKRNPGCISESRKGREATYRWSETASLTVKDVNQEELMAMGVLQHYGTDLIPQQVRRVLEPYFSRAKAELVERGVASGLSEPRAEKTVDVWLSKIAVLPTVLPFKRPSVDAAIESSVHEALFNEQTLSLRFKNRTHDPAKPGMTVSPLGIVQQGVRTYLVALDHRDRKVKTFLLHRIASAGPAREDYLKPNNWDLNRYLGKGIGKPGLPIELYGESHPMKFWVHGDTQWIKETPFHVDGSDSKITENSDGSFYYEGYFRLSEELIRWLLSMSYHVRVIEPEWLADRISSDIKNAMEMYQEKK